LLYLRFSLYHENVWKFNCMHSSRRSQEQQRHLYIYYVGPIHLLKAKFNPSEHYMSVQHCIMKMDAIRSSETSVYHLQDFPASQPRTPLP
jgi:hypothetical protein